MGLFDFLKKTTSQESYNEPEVVMLGGTSSLKIHHGRVCAKCGATSSELVKANNGMWDGLRFCPKCEKYFCARCQVGSYTERCPLCNEALINQA